MGLTIGTNCGFVTEAPVDDPAASTTVADESAYALRDTSDATATTITEMGWWCDTATEEANFEVGIYDDNGDNDPDTLLESDTTNAKGTDAGWKRVTGLNWSIDSSTYYWLAFQLDSTTTTTYTNRDFVAWYANEQNCSSLSNPWGGTGGVNNYEIAIYAVWEEAAAAAPPYTSVNIGDDWKSVSGANVVKVNVGDTWKNVSAVKVNVGDAWKAVTIV